MNCMDMASLFEIFFSVPNPIQAFMRQNMYPNRVSSEAQEGTSHQHDEETYIDYATFFRQCDLSFDKNSDDTCSHTFSNSFSWNM